MDLRHCVGASGVAGKGSGFLSGNRCEGLGQGSGGIGAQVMGRRYASFLTPRLLLLYSEGSARQITYGDSPYRTFLRQGALSVRFHNSMSLARSFSR